MIWTSIHLDLTEAQLASLKAHNAKVLRHLEEGRPLGIKVLEDLKNALSGIVQQSREFSAALKDIARSGSHTALQLLHSDNEILNLPWILAEDENGQALGGIPQLYLVKSLPEFAGERAEALFTRAAPPLKVLIMISSPEDADSQSRLSYEEEEFAILSAFQPLMALGQVEIDFTDDGSLEALERKLKRNKYHALHFSGHSVFEKEQGWLLLEHPLTLKGQKTPAQAFANALNCNPDHKVPFVMLSSCQSARGSLPGGSEEGLRGVANRLLQAGIPALIAMGMSVQDRYAAEFAAHFYRRVAEKQNLLAAFREALQHTREREFADLAAAQVARPLPLQWIIPNFYQRGRVEHLVDWGAARETLQLSSYRFITEQNRLLLQHRERYVFIGRRREKARILEPFFNHTPVLLKGQGGVGKTALAEYLVQRRIAAQPRTHPFLFNEKTRSLQDVLAALQEFLAGQGDARAAAEAARYEKALDQFRFLLSRLEQHCRPVFVFDNLETFQRAPGEEFAEEYRDLAEALELLCQARPFPLLLTARYPLPGFSNLASFDLNQVGLTDFWKKCHYLEIGALQAHLLRQQKEKIFQKAEVSFLEIVKLLHDSFGGNYRALEFFDRLYREDPGQIISALKDLEKLRRSLTQKTAKVAEQMRENLQFKLLAGLLAPAHLSLLGLLARFRVPVQTFALELQGWPPPTPTLPLKKEPVLSLSKGGRGVVPSPGLPEGESSLPALLQKLHHLTLLEISLDRETNKEYYYLTPLVKDLLGSGGEAPAPPFSPMQAGIYHYHQYHNWEASLTELEEAFYHFYEAGEAEKVQETGEDLANVYYNYSLFQSAFYYASRVFQLLGEQTSPRLLNKLGQILHVFGQYEEALGFFQLAAEKNAAAGDRAGEGTALNNISQIFQARGDYETALGYLERSLKILQEIGDKAGEGTTLNNMATTAYARGDYETALGYLERSLKIRQEIGDKAGEGTTLNNISQIYDARGDYETALGYLERVLKIFQELGDKAHEGGTLNNISQIFQARGDYETALGYLERSLKIRQEIGDKAGMIPTLHNMAHIHLQNQQIEPALEKFVRALQLAQETQYAQGLFNVSRDLGRLLCQLGSKEQGLPLLKQALALGQAMGHPGAGAVEALVREYS
ncbi:MAG: tetratricopeptide repeat protein [Calditrichia bacterium]|nr:tetratricopeptide repeat protein [Calditrichia bacterium]